MSGVFDGDMRFIGNYRTQWSSVTVPYLTYSGSFDYNLIKNMGYRIGGAFLVNRDIAGDSKFGTTQFGMAFAFHKPINHNFKQMFSLGIQGNFYQRAIDYSGLYFDNQYDGEMFNPNLSSNENFKLTNFNFFDFGGGINWQYSYNNANYFNVGMALSHINQPKESFFDVTTIKLDRKFCIYANNLFQINRNLNIIPALMFEKQGKYTELILNTSFMFKFENTNFYINPGFRLNPSSTSADAFIIATKFDVNNLKIGLSYDVNISGLVPASNYRGALEIAVIYIIKNTKIKKQKIKYTMCPVFL